MLSKEQRDMVKKESVLVLRIEHDGNQSRIKVGIKPESSFKSNWESSWQTN